MIAITLRLPDDLHARLVDLAQREHRSLNGQLVALLDQAIRGSAPAPVPPWPKAQGFPAKEPG